MSKQLSFVFFLAFPLIIWAQKEQDTIQKLEEVTLETHRISIPFSKNSHTLSLIDRTDLATLPVLTLDQAFQYINGIDVRRRGISGMQSDVYIRGGSFNQVLIMIDGVKMDDLQTGHHNMNTIISPDNIERIEVVKGSASRIYGQNAMNGAINIVSKKVVHDKSDVKFLGGTFGTYGAGFSTKKILNHGSVLFQIDKLQSDGYRYNTDFNNWNSFFKVNISQYEFLGTYAERKFGANGFYASPNYKDQYEETQTHAMALKKTWQVKDWQLKTKTYWRRNQDMYLFVRSNPALYRNMHINHKIGMALDASISHSLGQSGMGIDINQGILRSNNLGSYNRLSFTLFGEHRFTALKGKLDITPGIAYSYYSDFGSYAYPGIDIGYRWNTHFKTYANTGYTSRIPTYTNLYYHSATEIGNPLLKPENAYTTDFGFNLNYEKFHLQTAIFSRDAKDLIDWVKTEESDPWQAVNYAKVNSVGYEIDAKYFFDIHGRKQSIKLGYTYLDENIEKQDGLISRYELNSMKHQVVGMLSVQFLEFLAQNISYKYVDRAVESAYHVFDASLSYSVKRLQVKIDFNNIFDTNYTETNLVPMPGFHLMTAFSYSFL